jgi:signal transduction histidine kinase/HAMP domain-containing protein
MRLWLGATFAVVGVITAATVYQFVHDSNESVLSKRSTELAVGRTIHLADRLGRAENPAEVVKAGTGSGFLAWYFNYNGRLVAPHSANAVLEQIGGRRKALRALAPTRFTENRAGGVTVVAAPVYHGGRVRGALLGRYSRPEVLQSAVDRLRHDSLRALVVGVFIAILVGFLVASLITHRMTRLARSAENMAAGSLDVPLHITGRDEVGDLARALDKMRTALQDSFQVLSSQRDRLAAIFDGLTDAVMVVDNDGTVRFSNRSASEEFAVEGAAPPEAMVPYLRQAAEQGHAEAPALRIDDRVYGLQAREVPAEQGVLVVVRDRTEEERRELSEREFVSNAAHELRNPLAGISGAIEVLQAGAKDDPEALEHFLRRLSADAERMSRLMESLLTLARVEALGEGETEVVDVPGAASDAVAAVQPPDGVEVRVDVEPGLSANGDPMLLRQVLIGLLTNAIRHTPSPGAVILRGSSGNGEVVLAVADSGTGIPPEDVNRIFERFYRSGESLAHEGFGLGLAIAKRMVDVMGGEIGASSEKGRGSTFWVRLPAAEPIPTPVA